MNLHKQSNFRRMPKKALVLLVVLLVATFAYAEDNAAASTLEESVPAEGSPEEVIPEETPEEVQEGGEEVASEKEDAVEVPPPAEVESSSEVELETNTETPSSHEEEASAAVESEAATEGSPPTPEQDSSAEAEVEAEKDTEAPPQQEEESPAAEMEAEETPSPPEQKLSSEDETASKEETASSSTTPQSAEPEKINADDTLKAKKNRATTTDDSTNNTADPKNWGSYYDPQKVFCGEYDCYKILGIDFEAAGKKLTNREITKKYRNLSREWHPDKSKHKNAKEIFVKIARAYEVLTDSEKRKEYDHMRYNQEAYFQKYGSSVLWSYAPKSDATIIIIVILILANVFSWFAQKTRWQNVADRLVKAAVEDWSPSQGGSEESKQLRAEALKIFTEREKEQKEKEKEKEQQSNGSTAAAKPNKGSGKARSGKKEKKVSGKERRKQEEENITPIIRELVNQMEDFGGGFHKPTWEDLLIVSMARLPYKITMGTAWQAKYYVRRIQKKPLSDEEKLVLTERAVGPVTWDTSTEDQRNEMIKRELWVLENLAQWREEQEIKNLSAWEQKYIRKMQKKEKGKLA